MVRPVTNDNIGLKVLRKAPAETAQVIDIVAIHGIGAHPYDTWYMNVGTGESPRWVNWLEEGDMLPAVALNARIMRYGYQSQWFGEGVVRQNALTVARRLLLALGRERKDNILRPLLFIAHFFGGLIGLKALLKPDMFFGTPFRGAEGMSQMEMLEAARREYDMNEVQPEVLKILQPGNEFLQEVVDQFLRTRRQPNETQVACFYELKSSNIGKIVGRQDRIRFVVTEHSGCLDLSSAIRKFLSHRTTFT